MNILYLLSVGEGITSSENNEFGLDQDWNFPEDFDHAAFFIGDHESSRLNLKKFLDLISFVANKYILGYPKNEEKVKNISVS